MSTPENHDARGRLLTYLFWGGIGIAPLAALLLIVVGSSTAGLRFAALLAILAVVAIGLSVALRRDVTSVKLDIEETLLDEIDMLRRDVRADITTAARATHRALSEKVAHLHESVDQVRRQVDSGGFVELERAPQLPAVTAAPPRRPAVGSASPPGVVQRTETVRVTTRTIVDPDEDLHSRGNGGRPTLARAPHQEVEPPVRGRRDWDEPPPPVRQALAARDDSWPEQRVARNDFEVAARQAWREQGNDDPADDPRWSSMRGGDRWAEVRQDEHGRELRMAERRTAIRTDETGTQMRIVDRWSSVREEHPRDGAVPPTFENTGETRAQRRAREAAAQDEGHEQGPDRGRDHNGRESRTDRRAYDADASPAWDSYGARTERSSWDSHADRSDGSDRDRSGLDRTDRTRDRSDRSNWDRSSWDQSGWERSDSEPRPDRVPAARDDREPRPDRVPAARVDREPGPDRVPAFRDDWESRPDRGLAARDDREPRYDRVRAARDDRERETNGKPARELIRDSDFIPRPLDQPRHDDRDERVRDDREPRRDDRDQRRPGDRGYQPEPERIPAQRQPERYDEPWPRSDRPADRAEWPPAGPREAQRSPAGPHAGQWPPAGPREAQRSPAGPHAGQWPPQSGPQPSQPSQRDRSDERADNRWGREPSGQRSQTRRQYDFEVNDERWR